MIHLWDSHAVLLPPLANSLQEIEEPIASLDVLMRYRAFCISEVVLFELELKKWEFKVV